MQPNQEKPESWFQRHPKKTLFCVTVFSVLLIGIAAEKILEYRNHRQGIFLETERRYVKLREYRPLTRMNLSFPAEYRPFTDNVFTGKYQVDIDADGFIRPSRRYPHPDLTLVFLGGSTTECMFMQAENRFPFVVGTLLEKQTGLKVNSYNGGLSGNNSLHAIDLLVNKVIPLRPKVVVFMENINDLSTLVYEQTYWSRNTVRSPIETLHKVKLVGKLLKEILIPHLNKAYTDLKKSLWHQQDDEFAQARGKPMHLDREGLTAAFARNLRTFVCICRTQGIVPVLMTQANRIKAHPDPVVAAYLGRFGQDTGLSYAAFKELYDAFNDTIRRVGAEDGVLVIDLAREIPPEKAYLYDLVHFNDTGSRMAAQLIAARLLVLVAPERP